MTNQFETGRYVRVTVEGTVTTASDKWQPDVGYINVDTGYDVHNFDYNEVVSIEYVDPPFDFPETQQAVISGLHKSNGTKRFFHRSGDRWLVLGDTEQVLIWDDNGIRQEYGSLKTEWSGV